jgi:hypothetical protein
VVLRVIMIRVLIALIIGLIGAMVVSGIMVMGIISTSLEAIGNIQ